MKSLPSNSPPPPRPKPKRKGKKPLVYTNHAVVLNTFSMKLAERLNQPLQEYVHEDPGYEPLVSPLTWYQVYRLAMEGSKSPNYQFVKNLVGSIGPLPPKVSPNQAYWAHRIVLDTLYIHWMGDLDKLGHTLQTPTRITKQR